MFRKSIAHWSFAGGGLLAASIAIIPILANLVPVLNNIKEFEEALDLYSSWIREPLLGAIQRLTGAPLHWPIAIDLLVFWIAIFFSVNVFIHRQDGVFVWGHVRHNSCFLAPSSFLGQLFCTLPKYAIAFLASPLICFVALLAALNTGRSRVTMGYVTIDPGEVGKLVAASIAVPVLLLSICAWLNFKA